MNPTRAELAEVVEAAQAGDNRAWAELIARFQDAAVAMAVAYSGDWEGAPDVAQEAFGLAYRNFADLQDPRAFPGWFSTLVRTASARRTRRRQLALVPLDGVEIADRDKDPASVVTDDEDSVRLRAAVELLPEPERAVVALHYLGDLPYRDVAAFLGIGLSAAKKRAFTARRRLKETLPMVTEALRAARPSRGERFRNTILLFVAIRDHDIETVRTLVRADPSLAQATEDWSVDEALEVGLPFAFAGRASALIRAAQTGDVELVRVLVDAGAPVRSACDCAGAESPLWNATVGGDREVVEFLLEAGADANAPAFAGATPLHVAIQRGHHHLVPVLLASGADPDAVDVYGRSAYDWLAIRDPAATATTPDPSMVVTGIRALDLFAPLHRGGVQHWPPAVGLGQTVLLYAIADAVRPASFWLLGFEHGPYSEAGAEQESKETGVDVTVRLSSRAMDPAARRAEFGRALGECLSSPGDKLVALLQGPGHAHDVMLALPALAADPSVIGPIVIEPFEGTYPQVDPEPPEGFDAQVAFDVSRALRALWPAIDPARTTSRRYASVRHERLAVAAREALAGISLAGEQEVPHLVRYLAQPFKIAEPFTSRPGERTRYDEMLDRVEALLTP